MPCRVLGVLSGRDLSKMHLKKWAESADEILAADAGADLLREVGEIPNRIIGDLDSVSKDALESGPVIHKVTDQGSSDCDKLLAVATSLELAAITLIGVEGDRLDHVMGTIQSAAQSALKVRLALRTSLAWIIKPGWQLQVPTSVGRTVSLIPISVSTVTLSGVRWPLSDHRIAPGESWSLSNEAVEPVVAVSVASGCALLTVARTDEEPPVW